MNNNNKPSEADKQKYYEIAKWAAERGMSITMHWPNEESVDQLLTIFERANQEVPITGLRWSIAHLNNASPESLHRVKALGMGWTVQDSLYFGGEQLQNTPAVRRQPPVVTAKGNWRACGRWNGRAPGCFLQSIHRTSMVSRRQDG
jgi:predicted amidohydrolase YtcJ